MLPLFSDVQPFDHLQEFLHGPMRCMPAEFLKQLAADVAEHRR
jgi:hypothetical protein